MPGRSWVTLSLASRPDIFCRAFSGRTPRSLRLLAGQIVVPAANRSTSARRSRQLAARFLLHDGLRARDAADGGQADSDSAAELGLQRFPDVARDGGKSLLAGGVPGADEAAQRPLGLLRPARTGAGLGAVLQVAQNAGGAGLVPGESRPGLAPVTPVAAGDGDPGENGRIPACFMVSMPRVPRWNAEYSPVNAPWTYLFSPAGPDRC
jgi:hypothetical protein